MSNTRRLRPVASPSSGEATGPATYWNFERCEAVRGIGVVEPSEKPLHWADELSGQWVPVVRVTYHGQVQYLDDHEGRGWLKVTEGRGGPRCGHKNLNVSDFQVVE